MIDRFIKFACDNDKCNTRAVFDTYEAAQRDGWAICRDRKTCYCPACAPQFRHVGRKKVS